QQDFVAGAGTRGNTRVSQAPMQQDKQAGQAHRAHDATRRHRDSLLEAVGNTQCVPDDSRCQQTNQVPEEQANDADVEQNVPQTQIAAIQQLRAVAFPAVLLTFKSQQAAQQEYRQGYVWINTKNELMKRV